MIATTSKPMFKFRICSINSWFIIIIVVLRVRENGREVGRIKKHNIT